METTNEPLSLLLHGIKRLRQNLIFGIIALIIATIAAFIMIFSIGYAIMRGELVNPVSVIAPMITITVFALIPSFLYFDGARKLSQWNTSFYFYAKLALILIIISIAYMPIEILVINSIVSSINKVISSTPTYPIIEAVRLVQGQVALILVVQIMISIVSRIMVIILVRIFRDLGEAIEEAISRTQPAGQTPSFALWKLSEATTFLTWSYILGLFSSLTRLVSSAISGIIGLIELILYIIGLVRGFGGLSEAESATYFLKHSGLPLI